MPYNKKLPFTKRILYENEEEIDELDSRDTPLPLTDINVINKGSLTKNGFDRVEAPDDELQLSKPSKCLICCCGKKCWKTTESLNGQQFPHPFRTWDLLATFCSITFFFYDVISDILLAEKYYHMERWISFGFTAAFIFLPLLVLNLQSLRWYYFDYRRERSGRGHTSCAVWFIRVLFTFPFMIGTVIRHIEYLYHGCKSRSASLREGERKHHYRQMLHEDTDAGMMRMLEAFLESAPQLVLQMYIILTESPDEGMLMSIIRPVAMVGSWIGVSWSLVSYHKALRASHNEEESGLSMLGTIFYYLWRACEVGPRMIVLALFAAQFKHYMLIAVALHWILMSVWVALQKPEFYKSIADKIVFNIVIGYVLIFCFQNVQEGRTRYKALLYYSIVYCENIAMLIAWVYYTSHKSDWYYFSAIGVVTGGIALHITVQLIYYKCFHPKKSEIDYCITTTEKNSWHHFLCHEALKNESKSDAVGNTNTFDV